MKNFNQQGFTLIELMITIAILAILLGLGTPSLQTMIHNNQVAAQNNELMGLINFAKSESVRRNTDVTMLLTNGSTGWSAIVEDPTNTADIEGCVVGQLRCANNTRVGMTAGETTLVFNNRGYIRDADDAWAAMTIYLQHENCSGTNQRRRIDVTATGQVSSCALACDSTNACP